MHRRNASCMHVFGIFQSDIVQWSASTDILKAQWFIVHSNRPNRHFNSPNGHWVFLMVIYYGPNAVQGMDKKPKTPGWI